MKLSLAYSPCPNDTFMFHALATGQLRVADCEIETHLHDVETLNARAFEYAFDLTKLSFHAWLLNRERYRLLRSGAAIGFGCGPLVVAKRKLAPHDLPGCRVLLPGQYTTAHLLFRLWQPEAADKHFAPYDQIMDAVLRGAADAGVIIHESRFTYQEHGLECVTDLGAWWETQTGLPIPLGCVAAHRRLPQRVIVEFDSLLAESIRMAHADPQAAAPYMRQHAQELDAAVLANHVKMFVNEFSLDLGDQGQAAVEALERLARAAGVVA